MSAQIKQFSFQGYVPTCLAFMQALISCGELFLTCHHKRVCHLERSSMQVKLLFVLHKIC